jgi:DNA-binding Lrp family transcriptional regulator
MQREILEILRKNSKVSEEELAVMLNADVAAVKSTIGELEEKGVIIGYNTLIDWEKADAEVVTAYIEVKVTPQRGQGFDRVAERIYQYPQVVACSLMSGGYDLFVVVEGKTMKEVALFVAEKLAPIESVMSTATHFVLKKYKDNGIAFSKPERDEREAVVL